MNSLHHCQSSLMKQVTNNSWCKFLCIEFVFNTDVPGPVLLHQVTTNFTSITFLWIAPSNNSGVIAHYVIQLIHDGTNTIINSLKEMYVLSDLSPDTKVEFSVSAVSICRAVGVQSTTTEYTNSIRKSGYSIGLKVLSYFEIVNFCEHCFCSCS